MHQDTLWANALQRLDHNLSDWFYAVPARTTLAMRADEMRKLAEQGDERAAEIVRAVVTERMK